MFQLYANKNKLTVRQGEPVTSGSVNVYAARFQFSKEWGGLSRTAVFRAGTESWAVRLGDDNEAGIPWEVLKSPNLELFCGVYGSSGGTTVLPTVWASLGTILPGVSLGEESRPPTPDAWEAALAGKGDALGYTEDGDLGLYSGETLLSSVRLAGGGGYGVGHGLKVEDGDLVVDAVEDFTGDNTLPMTAAGVQTVVGNIEALLGTI